ncbi:MAG: hypothetical protein O2823_03170 [Actinomycetota bacterium]|nr:hypothetical protein [Actinomycetota bacterium]
MKRVFLTFLLIFSLQPSIANAVVIKSTKVLIELPYAKSDQISDVALTPVSVILIGTTESPNSPWVSGNLGGASDGFIASYSPLGAPLWNLRLGGIENEIATSAALDTDGSIWVLGASTSLLTPAPTPASGQVLNPDNVIPEPVQVKNSPLNRIKLWQISSNGNLLNTFEFISESIIDPRKILISGANLIIFGNSYTKSNVSGFYISASKAGAFSPKVKYGVKTTQINSAITNSDASFTAVGTSGDKLLKTKSLSKLDAVTMKVSSTGVLQVVGRATLKSTTRSWSSISAGLLQGGKVSYSNKTEAAVTKFSAISKPTWNVRYLAKSSALVTSGKNTWASFVSRGQIKSVSAWKPKTPSPIVLEFGKKGKVLNCYKLSAPAVAIAANNKIGTVLITDSGVSFGLVVIN